MTQIGRGIERGIERAQATLVPPLCLSVIADHSDPFAPLMHALLWQAVPALIVCGIIGIVLGDLRRSAEKWIECGVRGAFHKPALLVPAQTPSNLPLADETPHYPSCKAPMVRRQSKRRMRTGERFWGCSTYPACRGTRPIQAAAAAR